MSKMMRSAAGLMFVVLVSGAAAAGLKVESPSFRQGQRLPDAQVFNGFGCSGANMSPALKWTSVPAGTKSFALTVYDPDAPTGSGWWHWIVYNIPADTLELAADAGAAGGAKLPAGAVSGRNDFGSASFGGACPPPGSRAHRYIFTVHALKVERLELPADASAALIGFSINSNSLASGRLVATYRR